VTILKANALNSIFRISAQGEGFEGSIDSHFERFRDLYRQYDSASPTIRDVPTNPFVSATPDLDPEREQNRISHPIAKVLVELADIRYKKMLLHFTQAFSYSRTGSNNDLRADLMQWSLGEMTRGGIRVLSQAIQDLPRNSATDTASPTKAALAFTIPTEVFPTSNDEQWKLLAQLLDRTQELRNELFNVDPILAGLIDREVIADDDDKRLVIAAQTADSTDSLIV